MLAWLAGIGWQCRQAHLFDANTYILVGVAAALGVVSLAVYGAHFKGVEGLSRVGSSARRWCTLVAMIAVALMSFGFTGWRAIDRSLQKLDPSFEGVDLVVMGVIATLPRVDAQGVSFAFDVESATRAGDVVALPPTVLLGWYHPMRHDSARPLSFDRSPTDARAAQRWRFTVKLKQPHGVMNPHGFDFELWMFERRWGATGAVRERGRQGVDAPTLLGVDSSRWILRARQRMKERIDASVDDPRLAGVLAALSVGDQAAIHRDDWTLFRVTGVAHLMSISGLHVTMFAWLTAAMTLRLWRRSAAASLRWPAPVAAPLVGVVVAMAYAVFSGWGVPSQRTVWMLLAIVVLQLSGRRWPWPLVLLLAAVVVTVLDPWALLQPGFWLSFVAVGLLLVSGQQTLVRTPAGQALALWRRAADAALAGSRTQVIATVGLAPLTLFFFHQLSLVGFAANLLAIPVVTMLVTPLALLGVVWPALWSTGAMVLQALTWWLQTLADVPWAAWSVAVAPGWAQASGLAAGLLAIAPVPWRLRIWALPMVLPLAMPALPTPPHGAFEAVAVDVGQGTAVLLRTQRHLLLYDTGPMSSPQSNAGNRILLPLLRARGETLIHTLLLSHRDTDHVGGAASVMNEVRVQTLLSSIAPDHPLRSGVHSETCLAGQRWSWDGVDFEVLHPMRSDLARDVKASNSISCVLRVVDAQGRSMLLTGDIEAKQEAAILARGAAVQSDVLMVPHHGSKTSSTSAWLTAVAPSVGIVQAGYRNRYNHPAPTVVQRFEAHRIAMLRSDTCGAWTRRADAQWHCERDVRRRYWHHRSTLTSMEASR